MPVLSLDVPYADEKLSVVTVAMAGVRTNSTGTGGRREKTKSALLDLTVSQEPPLDARTLKK
eukprot:CAMPEP_0183316382 /NCGR_PEP_ID=MMETSP0160_2-20130417/54786_1 /TAXON_ID=2839 ORGANISM="Odontella Sinensis, Strain Grunow 1884" /NCGR_SAMPLE_ID=MMETSP0160_2 /ASSEMBLY_ACC=CAM_ASM_000250 /LENGTH=61 /DNA_ID=CAMNT_0025482169 /DNA_START=360 /DNA_END=545 /DNA_ORIENTATION=+